MKIIKKRGILLIIASLIMIVVSILTGVYLSGLVTEKRSVDTEREVLQTLNLAEAGAHLGFAEMRKRLTQDLDTQLELLDPGTAAQTIGNYVDNNNPLGFLRDFAFASGATQFTVIDNEATLVIPLEDYLNRGQRGNTWATPIITSDSPPTQDSQDGPFRFFYTYKIESTTRTWFGNGPDGIGDTADDIYSYRTVKYSPSREFEVIVRHDNFAKFALFTNHHRTPSGITVWFTARTNFTGPVHTNERFSFANNPSASFTAEVTQHLTTARFYNNGSPRLLDADSNPPRDVPNFSPAGFTRSVDLINLPSSVSQNDLLNQATGNRPPGSFTTDGIYLPNQGGTLDGGIYIRGNATNLILGVGGDNQPEYTITQGANTKRITIDYAQNQTIVNNISGIGGTPAGTYNGIPDGVGNEGIIIYGNGRISNFSGTVQRDTNITVSSDTDISINNHIMYQDYTLDDPLTPENELSAIGYTNLLGILTWNGNVRISTTAPNDLNIHGIVMAASSNGIFTVDNYGVPPPRGLVTLLGGAITGFYGPFGTFSGQNQLSGYGRNFVYDARPLEGETPPYFPFMTNFSSNLNPQDVFDTRTSWQESVYGTAP